VSDSVLLVLLHGLCMCGLAEKQNEVLETQARTELLEARERAREELQERKRVMEAVKALKKREKAERAESERLAIEASLAAEEAEKEEERQAVRDARARLLEQMEENVREQALAKEKDRERREVERVEMEEYIKALEEQEAARRRNFAKAFGTPSEHHNEASRLKEEAELAAKDLRRREKAEHAAKLAAAQAAEAKTLEDRRVRAAANRRELRAQIEEKLARKEQQTRMKERQMQVMRMRTREEEKEAEAERRRVIEKREAQRAALQTQAEINRRIAIKKREQEKLELAAKVYGVADDDQLLDELVQQLRARRHPTSTASKGLAVSGTGLASH
jgi:hypothetical protein